MMRECRLRNGQVVQQTAGALLSLPQLLQNQQTILIAQCFEHHCCLFILCCFHLNTLFILKFIYMITYSLSFVKCHSIIRSDLPDSELVAV